jgi:bifunctional non-homologous end joining protein LigD
MKLKEYRSKRDFTRTPEPPGQESREDEPALQFVVHKHAASHLHWDMRLELDGVLKSWAIPKGPSLNPNEKKLAIMVEDHPLDYGRFEGVIPKGAYGAGTVMVWDRGAYHAAGTMDRSQSEGILRKGLEKGHLSFVLEGEKLKGEFALLKLKKGEENIWLMVKKHDQFASEEGTVLVHDRSVMSGRTLEEIAEKTGDITGIDLSGADRAAFPVNVKPMLATLVEKPFDRPGWFFEIKWDGYRALAEIRADGVRLVSRNGRVLNDRFPTVAASLESLPFEALLDGELVVVDQSGRADFQLLQNFLRTREGNLVYYVFDLLYLNGYDLRRLPLTRRKSILLQALPGLPHVKVSEHVDHDGTSLFEAAKKNEVEGIIAKDGMSPYRSGQRGLEWLKIKTYKRQEAVIGGFTEPRGGRKGFGSLVLGVYEGHKLAYMGQSGGGFTEESLTSLSERLHHYTVPESPFADPPKTTMPITWVEPIFVCEVRFAEWTDEGVMRQPVFLGLREDKDPLQVRRELPGKGPPPLSYPESQTSPGRKGGLAVINDTKVTLTHLDKVFWPEEGYTKGDMIDYYRGIAPFLLPYLKDRPQSLHRHPDGITGDAFFQKNVDNHATPDWVQRIRVHSASEKKETNYLVCRDEATLIYMANLGCIEINPWHSRIDHLEYPDYMVLDLDPLDIPFQEVVRTAQETRKVLTEIGAVGFCKTSGATGLHVYVPLGARYSDSQSVQFARLINILINSRLPETTSILRNPEARPGRVYLDYLQNVRGQTLAAVYCLRPRKGAPVSTPLRWDEVNNDLDPSRFTMKTTAPRLGRVGDLWKGVLGPGIDMEQCLSRLEQLLKRRTL